MKKKSLRLIALSGLDLGSLSAMAQNGYFQDFSSKVVVFPNPAQS